MKLEHQVISLKIAQRLKELGVKQESLFMWSKSKITKKDWEWELLVGLNKNDGTFSIPSDSIKIRKSSLHSAISAFTTAELGEMLPERIKKNSDDTISSDYYLSISKDENLVWTVDYKNYSYGEVMDFFGENSSTEADARGLMLIYLLENKLITI